MSAPPPPHHGLIRYLFLFFLSYLLFPWFLSKVDVPAVHKELLRSADNPSLQWISPGLLVIEKSMPINNFTSDLNSKIATLTSLIIVSNYWKEAAVIALSIFVLSLSYNRNGTGNTKQLEAHAFVSKLLVSSSIFFGINQSLRLYEGELFLKENGAKQVNDWSTFQPRSFESYSMSALFASLIQTILVLVFVTCIRCLFFIRDSKSFANESHRFANLLSSSIAATSFMSLSTCYMKLIIAWNPLGVQLLFDIDSKSQSSPSSQLAFIITLMILLLHSSSASILLPSILRDAFNQAASGADDDYKIAENGNINAFQAIWSQLDSNIREASISSLNDKSAKTNNTSFGHLEVNAQFELAKALLQSSVIQHQYKDVEIDKEEGKNERINNDSILSSSSSSVLDQVFPHPLWPFVALLNWFFSNLTCSNKRSRQRTSNAANSNSSLEQMRLLATCAHALKQLSYLNEQEVGELLSSFLSVLQRVSDVAVVRHWVKMKKALDLSHKDIHCLCQRERMAIFTNHQTTSMAMEFSSSTPKSKNNLPLSQRRSPDVVRRPLSPQQQHQQQQPLHHHSRGGLGDEEEIGMSSPKDALPDGSTTLLSSGPSSIRHSSSGSLSGHSSVSSLLPQLHVLGTDDSGETKLHFAARNGLLDACVVLLDQGADVNLFNSAGNTPLHLALASGHEDVALLLVSKGASANVRNGEGELPDAIAEGAGMSSVAMNLRAAARIAMRSGGSPQKQQQQQQQQQQKLRGGGGGGGQRRL